MQAPAMKPARVRDGSRDFDFLVGHHRVHNVRFAGRLEDSGRWETFEANCFTTPLLRSLGHIGETLTGGRQDQSATMLYLYDRSTDRWNLYRSSSTGGLLQAPLVGAFRNGVGVFEGWEQRGTRTLRTRLTWSEVSGAGARCEQARSEDGERWEPYWIMRLTRVEPRLPLRHGELPLATAFLFSDPPDKRSLQ
jgi:hypothetical protein